MHAAGTQPQGVLRRMHGEPLPALASASTRDLACELLARMRGGESLDDWNAPVDLLAALSMEIEQRADRFTNRFSRARVCGLFHRVVRHLGTRLKLRDATVVELGCGSINPAGTLLLHVLAGAKRCIGIDLETPQDPASAARSLVRLVCYVMADPALSIGVRASRDAVAGQLAGFDLFKLWNGDLSGIDARRMELRVEPAEQMTLESGAADYVYSASFLEHVPDPDAVIAEIARVTRPGGLSIHAIDGADHRRYGERDRHPLDFLEEPGGAAMVHGSNRVRPLEFAASFERHGFELLDVEVHERVEVTAERRARFVEPWRSKPFATLAAVSVVVHARRSGGRRPLRAPGGK